MVKVRGLSSLQFGVNPALLSQEVGFDHGKSIHKTYKSGLFICEGHYSVSNAVVFFSHESLLLQKICGTCF